MQRVPSNVSLLHDSAGHRLDRMAGGERPRTVKPLVNVPQRRLVHDSGDDAAIDLARLTANEIDDVILWRIEDIAAQV